MHPPNSFNSICALIQFVRRRPSVKPQEISLRRINADQGPLIVGQSATFECLTHGSRPKANVYWLFDGKRLDPPMNGKCIYSYESLL